MGVFSLRKTKQRRNSFTVALDQSKINKIKLAHAVFKIKSRGITPVFPPKVKMKRKSKLVVPEIPVQPLPPSFFLPSYKPARPMLRPVTKKELVVGRVVEVVEGVGRREMYGSDATVDISYPMRAFIIGSSGAGKTNLCKVLIEEYFDKGKDRHILVLDNENEYAFMARKSTDPTIYEFGLSPKEYPVRIISLQSILDKYRDFFMSISPSIELSPVTVDWSLINTTLLQLLTGFTKPEITPFLQPAVEKYLMKGDYSLEGLESALESAEQLSDRLKIGMIARLEELTDLGVLSNFDYRQFFHDRKINVFFIPASMFSSDEITFWAVFFSTFARRIAEEWDIPLFVVMDEAREYAKAMHQRKVTKQEIGSIFTKGRKRDIDAVISTNSSEIITDILPNVTHSFFLKFRATSSFIKEKIFPSDAVAQKAKEIPRYHAILWDQDRDLALLAKIRPARSFNPPHRRYTEEALEASEEL